MSVDGGKEHQADTMSGDSYSVDSGKPVVSPLETSTESPNGNGRGDSVTAHSFVDETKILTEENGAQSSSYRTFKGSKAILPETKVEPSHPKAPLKQKSSLRHMHDLYETVAEMTVEPVSENEPDMKAFFKVLRKHRLQSKFAYVLTVVAIVCISHFVLTVRWLLPYYYSISTPALLLLRLIMYWKMKYQYFLLDFCYFANIYWCIYIWVAPGREEMFAVGFAIANGPLIWALFVFRNSLVFHSLDKVTSLYIHLLPSLMSFVIRWFPNETSERWIGSFPHSQYGFSFIWLVCVPFAFLVVHQVLYIILVHVVLKPSEEYMNLYRYVMNKETSLFFRMCNICGQRWRDLLYIIWCSVIGLVLLLFNPIWYNFFISHCVILVFFIIIAIFNGATYYIDVFSLEGIGKSKACKLEPVSEHDPVSSGKDCSSKTYGTLVSCAPNGEGIIIKPVQ